MFNPLKLFLKKSVFPTPSKHSFCETQFAGGASKWHIRELTGVGRKLGGGADTPSLCGKTVAWDIKAEIKEHHLANNTCSACLAVYRSIRP